MEEKSKVIGEIDLFQKFTENRCRTKMTTARYPSELINVFSSVDPSQEGTVRNALVLLKSTELFGINWDMCISSRNELIAKLNDIIEYLSAIKYVRLPHRDGTCVPIENEGLVFGRFMVNWRYFQLGINKIVPVDFLDECISTCFDLFDTEKLRYLIDVQIKTNNLEFLNESTNYHLPLVNVQNHKYVYNTSIGVVILMTVVGFLGLIVIVNAIDGYPPLSNEDK